MAFQNVQGIKEICFHVEVVLRCPMGNDYYVAKIEVRLVEPGFIPDYMDIQEKINAMEGGNFIMEDAVAAVREILDDEHLECKDIEISCTSSNAHHFPVTVKG